MLDPCPFIGDFIGDRRAPSAGRFSDTRRSRLAEAFPNAVDGVFGPLLSVLLGGLLLVGCGGQGAEPDVSEGRFTAYVEGAVSDTLRGVARARHEDDALVGLELGEQGESGLSIELEPHPPGLRSYEVVDPQVFRMDRRDGAPDGLAFLHLDRTAFEATGGTLELTYVSEEQVGATFTFRMEGALVERGGDAASIEVTGEVNAPTEE